MVLIVVADNIGVGLEVIVLYSIYVVYIMVARSLQGIVVIVKIAGSNS